MTAPLDQLPPDAVPSRLELLRRLETVKRRRTAGVLDYYDDPVGFAHHCIRWGGQGLADYQAESLSRLAAHHRLAVRGPRGLGKTTTAAVIFWWFALTRDAAGKDWKIGTTAGSWRQLTEYLWPEIHKWAKYIRWSRIGRPEPRTGRELLTLGLDLDHGHAFAAAAARPELLEGAHADAMLFIFDESKAVSPSTFDSIEGSFSGAGPDSPLEAFAFAVSTPGEPNGRFYDIHARRKGLEDWDSQHVTTEQTIAAGRLTRTWVEQRRKLWGENSALFQNHAAGEFFADDETGVIPLAWVESAVERWHAWDHAGRPEQSGRRILGVDVARGGADKTAIATRQGPVVIAVERSDWADTMRTAGTIHTRLQAHPHSLAVIDVIGVGAGVVDRVRELGHLALGFNASERSQGRDHTGELGFPNQRSEAWWHVRELLDPRNDPTLCLPPDDELLGDLTAPHWTTNSRGQIVVESRDDILKRIGRSPDTGTAVVQALWPDGSPPQHGPGAGTAAWRAREVGYATLSRPGRTGIPYPQ